MSTAAETYAVRNAGSSLVLYPPVFSRDCKYIFIASGRSVRVYSINSGECVHELECSGIAVAHFLSPRNHLQLVVCSRHGHITFWDYEDGIPHKTYHIPFMPFKVWMPRTDGVLYVLDRNKLFEVNNLYSNDRRVTLLLPDVKNRHCVVFGVAGEFLATINAGVLLVKFPGMVNKDESREKYSCIAAHPTEYCVATGNTRGKIYLWYNLQESCFTQTVLHWHQMPVSDIVFTASGSQILSVGEECVLVKWKVDSNTKTIVPRLGMPIKFVVASDDNTLAAICHIDNTIQLMNSQGDVIQAIQGLTQMKVGASVGIQYDAKSGSIVLNGQPGHLQFFLPRENKLLFNLDITYQNFRHNERNHSVSVIEVTQAAFDPKGDWLATVELRDDGGVTSIEIRLKFWKFIAESREYALNTTVELPHLLAIKTLKFRPQDNFKDRTPLAVTTSDDQRFKIWTLRTEYSDVYQTSTESWFCESVGYYRKDRAGDAAFSEDGSLLAVAFNATITTWDPETNALKGTLYNPQVKGPSKKIEFGRQSCDHLLVSMAATNITVWNTLTSSIEGYISWCIECLVSDPFSEFMAAFDNSNNLFVFRPSDLENPVYTHARVTEQSVVTAAFIPRDDFQRNESEGPAQLDWSDRSQLFFVDSTFNLFTIDNVKRMTPKSNQQKVRLQSNIPETPFATLLNQGLKVEEVADIQPNVESASSSELFTSASHMLPPARLQCVMLHKQFLRASKDSSDRRSSAGYRSDASNEEWQSDDEGLKNEGKWTVVAERTRGLETEDEVESEDIQKLNAIVPNLVDSFDWLGNMFAKKIVVK